MTDSFEKDVLFVRSLILKESALGLIIIEKKEKYPWCEPLFSVDTLDPVDSLINVLE